MRKPSRRVLAAGLSLAFTLAALPALFWLSLTHKPKFYKAMVGLPRARQQAGAKRFVAQSLQLRNDICNEPTWEAVFTDGEVNAWLAEDLMAHFADQLPPEVHEPRLKFEVDRVTLAFGLDRGPVRTVVWIVARPHVPEGNVLELTVEKVRAGVVPVAPEALLERVAQHARARGLEVHWKHDGEHPVAVLRYAPIAGRDDVKLERIDLLKNQMRLAGRSDRLKGKVAAPTLPTRRVLQSKFPSRKAQPAGSPPAAATALRNSAMPRS